MKRKTINNILTGKFKSFVKTIEDEEVKKKVENGTIITGGCIVSLLLNEEVNDFDLYFKDFETTKAVAEYYVKKFKEKKRDRGANFRCSKMEVRVEGTRVKVMIKSSGVESETTENENYQYFEQLDVGDPSSEEFVENALNYKEGSDTKKKGVYKPVFLTSNTITLSNGIQLVLRFYGEPEEIHKNYDFVHCTNYWTSWDRELVLRAEALEHILNKTLVYNGSLYPICSLFRIRKFIKRGWNITAGEIFKMAWQVAELDLNDTKILEDQLIGVDQAYFIEVIDEMQQAKEKGVNIDSAYVMEIIDRLF